MVLLLSSSYTVFRTNLSRHQLRGFEGPRRSGKGHQEGLLGRCPTSRPFCWTCVIRHREVGWRSSMVPSGT